ncbi:MAG: fimbria major subunit, partial [Prevotella sp.]|nr:fimbria major subunit [Prevotella sp.]
DLATSGTSKVFEGDVAYLKVNVSDVGTTSTRADQMSYVYGSEAESTIANAHFYFYDKNGNYVTEGQIGGTSGTTAGYWSASNDETPGSVEKTNEGVVILEGLTGKEYPRYVVTLLNKPTNFTRPTTLKGWESLTRNTYLDGSDNYVMTTSSYKKDGTTDTRPYSWVTELTDDDFQTTSVFDEDKTTNSSTVNIYVERLSSKVNVRFSEDLEDLIGSQPGRKITETLGDMDNVEEENNDIVGTDLYVKLLAWGLNATSQNIYLMKRIDSSWTWTNWFQGDWNDATNCRSYWAEGCSYNGLDANGESVRASETKDSVLTNLNYITFNDILAKYDDTVKSSNIKISNNTYADETAVYCLENTNTAGDKGIIKSKYSPAITSVIVAGQIVDGEGNSTDLIRYKGILYKLTDFPAALSYEFGIYTTAAKGKLNGNYLHWEDHHDGTVSVTLKVGNDYTYYNENGVGIDDPNSLLADDTDGNDNAYTDEINYYNNGYMYYMVPIEHLNTSAELEEGDYGIVRNHYYQIAINDIKNLGTGVYKTDSKIIPSENGVATAAYEVVSDINIQSYAAVPEQEVTLE